MITVFKLTLCGVFYIHIMFYVDVGVCVCACVRVCVGIWVWVWVCGHWC